MTAMRDMLVVELVEGVLVDVLDVHPETVLPHARLAGDLGATPADVRAVLQRLEQVLPSDAVDRLVPGGPAEPAGSFSVEDLVDLVESTAAVRATTADGGQRAMSALPRPRRTVSNTISSPR
jgi:hypothetical protein